MSSGTGRSLAMLPWFARDYIAATRHMSLAERGAYTDLLFFEWENGPLPREPERLARLIGCAVAELEQVWPAIRPKFQDTPDGLTNRRLEEHRAEAHRLRDARARGAKTTNRRRSVGGYSRHGAEEALGGADCASPSGTLSGTDCDTLSEALSGTPPSPSPSPPPESGVFFEDSRPRSRATKPKPAYMSRRFHQQVIDAYHELLSDLPRVKAWSAKREGALNARITERVRDGKPADTIEYWTSFFEEVRASDFLCGRSSDFRCDLEWLLRPENFLKVIEGRYTNSKRANGGNHGSR